MNLGNAARWMVLAAPVMVMAQSSQVGQPSQPPAVTPAPASGTSTTRAERPAQPAPLPVAPRVLPPAGQPAAAVSAPAMPAPQVLNTPSANAPTHDLAAVDFSHGELTVVAQRASLGLVLKLIAAKTGAIVDLAPELQNEPVVAQLGPAPAREVLIALLDSPRVDYIVLAPGNDPNGIQRVVVRARLSFARVPMAAIQPSQPRPAEPQPETRLGEDGHPRNGFSSVDANMTQEQRMEEWRKVRESMRVAEVKQQAEDREREKTETQPPHEPQPQPQPQPDDPPQR